jgi:hypothetical protein
MPTKYMLQKSQGMGIIRKHRCRKEVYKKYYNNNVFCGLYTTWSYIYLKVIRGICCLILQQRSVALVTIYECTSHSIAGNSRETAELFGVVVRPQNCIPELLESYHSCGTCYSE